MHLAQLYERNVADNRTKWRDLVLTQFMLSYIDENPQKTVIPQGSVLVSFGPDERLPITDTLLHQTYTRFLRVFAFKGVKNGT